jgi:tripartite-type tricarboxylate transporter receptor subunit TctC
MVLCVAGPGAAQADAVEDFYRGKQIKIYINTTPGSGYDIYARLVARFLGDHIPGKPAILAQNMAGAEGRLSAAYVYNVVAKDGLSIAALNRSVALAQAMGEANLPFDNAKFNWIGNVASDNSTLVTWHTSGVKTLEDAKAREVTIGATGDGNSSIYPRVLNAVLGTKFKVIRGYPGGSEINLAMENGEVGGRGDNAWSSWKVGKPGWLADGKINILVQVGLTKAPDLPGPPLLIDLAANADDRALFKFLSEPAAIGHPFVTSPGVPAERVAALRAAFDAMLKDEAFLAEAKRQKRDIVPSSGAELAKVVEDILTTPKPIRDRLAGIIFGPDAKK